MNKGITNTSISLRISFKEKEELIKIAKNLQRDHNFSNATVTDVIKIALTHTWGIKFSSEDE